MDSEEERTARILKWRIEKFFGTLDGSVFLDRIRVYSKMGTVVIPTRLGVSWDWSPHNDGLVFPATFAVALARDHGARLIVEDFGNPYGCSNRLMCFEFPIAGCEDAIARAGHFADVLVKYQHGISYVKNNEKAIMQAAMTNAAATAF